jgi:uncharacterized membrane protein
MKTDSAPSRFSLASAVFHVLDPIPFGFFVGVLVFDVIYAKTANVLWMKGAAWLVSIGLVVAIVPQLINLHRVWFRRNRFRSAGLVANFWLNVAAIVAALVNAFVHSRDAYGVIPDALWLSAATVLALAIGRIVLAGTDVTFQEVRHGQA